MTNNRLLFIMVMYIGLLQAQYTLIPDPNFEQALINLGIDDDGLNGQFLTANAINIQDLDVSHNNINDLTGLEAFVDLHDLIANDNNLTDVNLSVLPNETIWTINLSRNNLKNINLTSVNHVVNLFLNNNNLTEINASNLINVFVLQVSSNQNLTNLNIFNCINLQSFNMVETPIQTIDLSSNISLRWFNARNSQITSLDFTNNQNLEELKLDNTPLTNINLPNQPSLDFLSVSNTLLTILDISNCPSLLRLECSNNSLTQLDLTGNPNLEKLICGNGQLTSIDVSQSPNLVWLLAPNNPIISNLDLTNNSLISSLNLKETLLTEIDLTQNTKLDNVFFSDNINLELINLKNGSNLLMSSFTAINCPELTCVIVDDTNADNSNITVSSNTTLVNSLEECEDLISITDNEFNLLIKTYPNPTQGILQIENNSNVKINKIEIFTISGKLIKTETTNFKEFNLPQLNKGVYLIKINTRQGIATKKIIKN